MEKLEPTSVLEYHIINTKSLNKKLKQSFITSMRNEWKDRLISENKVAFNSNFACAREMPRIKLLEEVTEYVRYWDIREDRDAIVKAWEKEDEENEKRMSKGGCFIIVTLSIIFLIAVSYVIWAQ